MNVEEYLRRLREHDFDDREELVRRTLSHLGRESLFFLTKYVLGYGELTHYTHDDVVSTLEDRVPFKLIVMPRGTFKSTLCDIGYPIWRLIRDPNLRILLDSELQANSSNFLREIKGHLNSRLFTWLYGSWEGPVWNETEIIVSQRTKARKEGSIICSGIGAGKTGQHYDLIIGDDYNSPKNSGTPELRQKVIDHYKLNHSILEPDGEMVIVGTRYAEDDVIGHILSQEINIKEEENLELGAG